MNTDGFQPFLIFSSPWEQVAVFFFLFLPPPLSVLSRPVFEVSLSLSPLHHGSHLIWGDVP